MPLVPLLPLFHRFNREFFDGCLVTGSQPILDLRWSDGRLRKTAGFYRRAPLVKGRRKSEIVLSRPILECLPLIATESTLCHEMIHAWIDLVIDVKEGHGPLFQSRMNSINSCQSRFQVTLRHKFPVPKTQAKWNAICPLCETKFSYQRLLKGAACRNCCNQYYSGNWSANCLLIFESTLKER